MVICTYKKMNNGYIEAYANDAPIGYLYPDDFKTDWLRWDPSPSNIDFVRFQFRKEETFLSVVNALRKYRIENGFKYLIISCLNNGYASQLEQNMLARAGFIKFPAPNNNDMFLYEDI